ncbi:MAG: NADH-quinone oxidoreductase subunit N [Dehalococcoidia bacterium]|nr:NADH-quinone oxidoreductase subunit N [Dehalococcoidia bacterium]
MRDYTLFIPEYIAAGGAVAVIAVELIWPRVRKDILAYATAIIALAWGVAALFWIGKDPLSFQGLIQVDDFTTFFRVLGAGIVFVTALLSAQFIGERSKVAGEYFGLLLIAGCGMAMMAAARELLTAYLSLEVLSFSLYILVGFYKRDKRSSEASLKYILLGAFASATLLYGISLIYGITGSTYYDGIADGLASRASGTDAATLVALMLVLAGVGFKVSAMPFHMWAPDAYQGASMPITAFLSTLSKAAGFALILRLFTGAFLDDAEEWRWAVASLAAITMVGGNLIAIQQTDLKRLIAYSSIGQVGYMLIVIAAIGWGDELAGQAASSALLLHIVGYVASTLALFAAAIAYFNRTGKDSLEGMRGMAETQPFLALVITASLFSFAGLPLFAGFATKLFMFQASTAGGDLLWLIGVAVASSFISLFYYLRIMRWIWLFDPVAGMTRFRVPPMLWSVTAVLMLAVVFIGAYPAPVFEAADEAVKPLFQLGADIAGP